MDEVGCFCALPFDCCCDGLGFIFGGVCGTGNTASTNGSTSSGFGIVRPVALVVSEVFVGRPKTDAASAEASNESHADSSPNGTKLVVCAMVDMACVECVRVARVARVECS